MSPRRKSFLLRYGITTLVALLVAVLYIWSKNIPSLSLKEKYRAISDGFAIPGMLLTCFGLMLAVASMGALDGVIYGLRYLALSLIPGGRKKIQRYGDYLEMMKQKRITGTGFMVHVGLLFCAISFIFVVLYNKV
ncbi:MAG: DUF3899 domain-containing protein [Erysipelotrichaceae bacterium]|nr:DUF3899 domain-containing protein [Erysipelotrichaceae bacterium]